MTVLASVLFAVSLLSFWKYRTGRLLLVSGMLAVFVVRSVLLSIGLFIPEVAAATSSVYIWGFDIAILGALYATVLKR